MPISLIPQTLKPAQGCTSVHDAAKPMLKRLFTQGYESGLIDGAKLSELIAKHGLMEA